jgi:hypothetical protein
MKKIAQHLLLQVSANAIAYLLLSIYWNEFNPSNWMIESSLPILDTIIIFNSVILLLLRLVKLVDRLSRD